tara:strand:+ start:731 stop:973 length:243 start_codon:yes stop_codon:yes gene_type:complete
MKIDINEVIVEFDTVYQKSMELARMVSSDDPTREDVLAIAHMILARKDSEFEKAMAIEIAEKEKLEAVYGRGYSNDVYEE